MISLSSLRSLSSLCVAVASLWLVTLVGSSLAFAQSDAAQSTGDKGSESSAVTPSNPDIEVRPDAKAGPREGLEKVDLETNRLIRLGRQLDPKNKLNSRIGRYMAAAIEKQDEDGPEASLKLLARLNPKRLNRMERASVARVQAPLYYATGEMDAAIAAFQRALDEETLPLPVEDTIRFQIAQLLAGMYRWEDAINAVNEWFRHIEDENSNPLAYYLLGIANFQLGDLDLAIVNTEKAIEIEPEAKQGWLQLLAAAYVQKQNFAKAAPVLEELVVKFPKKQYWVQLGLVYGAMEEYRAQLAVQQVAYAQGLLTEDSDLRRLARSYLYAELPYPAAKVLEKGINEGKIKAEAKSLELLANSWIAAREYEKSLPPLLKAAEVSADGNLFVRLGQVFLQREDWAGAAARFEDAIKKGDLSNEGNVNLLLGIAYYNNKQMFRAKSSFVTASQFEKTRKDAERWIEHLEKETAGTS